MQVPGMIIQGHGKYGAFQLDKAPVNSDPVMAGTAGMATVAAEWRGLATPLRLSKPGLVGPGTLPVYKHQKLAKFEQAYTCTIYTERKQMKGYSTMQACTCKADIYTSHKLVQKYCSAN